MTLRMWYYRRYEHKRKLNQLVWGTQRRARNEKKYMKRFGTRCSDLDEVKRVIDAIKYYDDLIKKSV